MKCGVSIVGKIFTPEVMSLGAKSDAHQFRITVARGTLFYTLYFLQSHQVILCWTFGPVPLHCPCDWKGRRSPYNLHQVYGRYLWTHLNTQNSIHSLQVQVPETAFNTPRRRAGPQIVRRARSAAGSAFCLGGRPIFGTPFARTARPQRGPLQWVGVGRGCSGVAALHRFHTPPT